MRKKNADAKFALMSQNMVFSTLQKQNNMIYHDNTSTPVKKYLDIYRKKKSEQGPKSIGLCNLILLNIILIDDFGQICTD